MADGYAPIRGKCTWWRELPVDEDLWDANLPKTERRIRCSCFVEGDTWTFTVAELPEDCPKKRACRYYIRNW